MKILLLCLLFQFTTFAKIQINESKWKKSVDEDGVVILSQKIKGHDTIAFRTIYTVNAPIDKLLTVLRDAENSIKWSNDLEKVKYISEPSDLEAIIYEIRKFPWPLSKRDLTVHYLLSINEKRESISVKFNSIDHKDYPKQKGKVRAKLYYGLFEFWPLKNKTKIELTVLADPEGSIPGWVANFFQKTMPFEYIKQLEKQARASTAPIRPGLKKAIEQYFKLFPDRQP